MPKFLFFLFIAFTTLGQTPLDDQLATAMKKYNTVGLAVAVVHNDKVIYDGVLGKKSIAGDIPLEKDDMFRIASISKSFTATAILQLVEKKKLKLNDDIGDLLGFQIRNPAYPDTKITVKMLLSHTSSLNDSQGYFELDVIHPEKNPEAAKCYNPYAPGTEYQYCNLNFNLLGTVIEKLSGERFDQYIVKHILTPLGLSGGYCVDSLDQSKLAKLYTYDKGFVESTAAYHPRREIIENYVMGYSTPVFSPTGGMKISAHDLAQYMQMHMNYGITKGVRIIKKKSSKQMQTPVNQKTGYGLALTKTSTFIPNKEMVGHTGSAYGLYSTMFFNPKEKFGIVAITNGCETCQGGAYNKLLQEVSNLLYATLILKK
jgi:CubicO group peptidase (beta-lactamase class C family)